MIGSRHDVLDEKEKKKKSKGEVAGQSRLVKYPNCLEMWSLCFVQLG